MIRSLLLAGCTLLLLSTGSVRLVVAEELPSDVAFVPDNPGVFLSINLPNGIPEGEAETFAKLRDSHPIIPAYWLRGLEPTTGLKPSQIRRAMAIFPADGSVPTYIIRTATPIDFPTVQKTWAPETEKQKLAGVDVHVDQDGEVLIYLADRKTLVVTSPELFPTMVKRYTTGAQTATGKRYGTLINSGAMFVLSLHQEALVAVNQFGNPALAKMNSLDLVLFPQNGLTGKFIATFPDAETTGEFGPLAKELLADVLGTGWMPVAAQQMPMVLERSREEYPNGVAWKEPMAITYTALGKALKEAKLSIDEKQATIRFTIPTETPVSTAALILALAPRPTKDAPDPEPVP